MASKERRERNREDLRRKILEAAQQIITTEGFGALSMRKLADRIEYSPASIYLHFRSREHIAQELGEVGFGQLFSAMSAAAGREKDATDRMRAAAMAYIFFGTSHPETYRLILTGDSEYMTAAFAEATQEATQDSAASRFYLLLIEIAEEGTSAGRYKANASAEEIAKMVWAAIHGIVSLQLVCPGFLCSAANLAELTIDALLGGLMSGDQNASAAGKPRSRGSRDVRLS